MVMFHSYVSFRGILVYKGPWDVKGTIKDRCTSWENDKYNFKDPWMWEMPRVFWYNFCTNPHKPLDFEVLRSFRQSHVWKSCKVRGSKKCGNLSGQKWDAVLFTKFLNNNSNMCVKQS